jgi:hypothetical protein
MLKPPRPGDLGVGAVSETRKVAAILVADIVGLFSGCGRE